MKFKVKIKMKNIMINKNHVDDKRLFYNKISR